MKCPRCQVENIHGARFCEDCGARLELTCPSCGQPVTGGKRFCRSCGATLTAESGPARYASPESYTPKYLAEKILTSRAALEGERKQVTVLFCDLVNSTSVAERLGSDTMHRLLDRFFTLALREIHRYEGTVNQFLGDGLMALFGAPVAHEQHARQALLAAHAVIRAVREGLTEFRSGHGVDLAVRIALDTGPVVVGKIGDDLRMDYTAIGDTSNTAARLRQMAEADTALLSEATWVAAGENVEVEFLGLRLLKGKTEPVRVYKLAGVGRPSADSARRLRSPLVGRALETRQLEGCLAQAAHGAGGIVCITGEPGVGNSRLMAEARGLATAGEVLWLEGRSLSFTQRISYWPLIEILRRYAGIKEDDAEVGAWTKLEARVSALCGSEAPEILPYLGTLLGLTVPEDLQDRVRYLDEL